MQRLAIRNAVVEAPGSLNHTTEEIGRFLGLRDGEAFCDFRGGDSANVGTRRKELSDVSEGDIARMLITGGASCGEDLALYLGGGTTVAWLAKLPTKGGGLGEAVHSLATGAMKGIADEGLGMVKVSITGLEGPMT